ncbi:hypothetical protein H920_18729 [Fukomys damarensis]|uniref:Uncharacterized protein n=1 Tax=Fukomys damarensis TaxID=885580 RepID=A0A091CPB7_FUKDA|nr:hypothetical protein H920_18729 [Fukomys damarensis]
MFAHPVSEDDSHAVPERGPHRKDSMDARNGLNASTCTSSITIFLQCPNKQNRNIRVVYKQLTLKKPNSTAASFPLDS